MKTIEWRVYLADVDADKREKFISAITDLEEFDKFVEAFKWTGLFKLRDMAKEFRGY